MAEIKTDGLKNTNNVPDKAPFYSAQYHINYFGQKSLMCSGGIFKNAAGFNPKDFGGFPLKFTAIV